MDFGRTLEVAVVCRGHGPLELIVVLRGSRFVLVLGGDVLALDLLL